MKHSIIALRFAQGAAMICGTCRELAMFRQIYGKVVAIGQNCRVVQNSWGLVEFALIVVIA